MNAELVTIEYDPRMLNDFCMLRNGIKYLLLFREPTHHELARRIFTGLCVKYTENGTELQSILITAPGHMWICVRACSFIINQKGWTLEVVGVS